MLYILYDLKIEFLMIYTHNTHLTTSNSVMDGKVYIYIHVYIYNYIYVYNYVCCMYNIYAMSPWQPDNVKIQVT